MQTQSIGIGHGVRDITPEGDKLGGALPYGIIADVRSQSPGMVKPTAVTKMGRDEGVFHKFVDLAQQEKFQLINIASQNLLTGITSYANDYDAFNRREQKRYGFTTDLAFDEDDLSAIRTITRGEEAHIFIGTVSGHGEMTPGFVYGLREVARNGIVSATIQGWHRYTDEQSIIYQKPLADEELEKLLFSIDVCALSDEDIAFGAKDTHGFPVANEAYLQKLAKYVPLLLLTQGEKGVRVLRDGKDTSTIGAFPLTHKELSESYPTGLGDTFAAVAAREISRGVQAETAVAFAEVVAAAKLAGGPGTIQGRGEGMQSLLTLDQIRQFTTDRASRVLQYADGLKQENPQVQLQELLHDTYRIDLEGARQGKEGQNPMMRR